MQVRVCFLLFKMNTVPREEESLFLQIGVETLVDLVQHVITVQQLLQQALHAASTQGLKQTQYCK
jgi:hypothetical protein